MSKVPYETEKPFNFKKFFVKFKKDLFHRIKIKYSNPYMYHTVKKSELIGMKEYQIPTYFESYQINNLMLNKACHYNAVFRDQVIINNEKEILLKKYNKYECEILIQNAWYKLKRKTPQTSLFPHEGPLLDIALNFYENTEEDSPTVQKRKKSSRTLISRTDTKIVKILPDLDSRIQNEEKENSSEMGTEHYNSKLYLDSLLESNDSSNNKSSDEGNDPCGIKVNKNKKRADGINTSTYSLENLVEHITQIEYDQQKIKPIRRQALNVKTFQGLEFQKKKVSKHDKFYLTNLKENFKERNNIFYKTIKVGPGNFLNKLSKEQLPLTSEPIPLLRSCERNSEFKTTTQFLKVANEKERNQNYKKKELISVLLTYNKKKIEQEKEKEISKLNQFRTTAHKKVRHLRLKTEDRINLFPNKIRNHKYCETSTTFNSLYCHTHNEIVNLYDVDNDVELADKTGKLIQKVKNNIKLDSIKVHKSIRMSSLIQCPSIYFPKQVE